MIFQIPEPLSYSHLGLDHYFHILLSEWLPMNTTCILMMQWALHHLHTALFETAIKIQCEQPSWNGTTLFNSWLDVKPEWHASSYLHTSWVISVKTLYRDHSICMHAWQCAARVRSLCTRVVFPIIFSHKCLYQVHKSTENCLVYGQDSFYDHEKGKGLIYTPSSRFLHSSR